MDDLEARRPDDEMGVLRERPRPRQRQACSTALTLVPKIPARACACCGDDLLPGDEQLCFDCGSVLAMARNADKRLPADWRDWR